LHRKFSSTHPRFWHFINEKFKEEVEMIIGAWGANPNERRVALVPL
jgi:hypothetical protein